METESYRYTEHHSFLSCQTSHSRSKREKKGPSFMYYRHLSSLENKRQYRFLLCIFVYFELYKVMLFCFTPWFCLCFNKLEECFKHGASVLSIQKNIRDQEHSANIISECSLNIQKFQFEPFLNIKGTFHFFKHYQNVTFECSKFFVILFKNPKGSENIYCSLNSFSLKDTPYKVNV